MDALKRVLVLMRRKCVVAQMRRFPSHQPPHASRVRSCNKRSVTLFHVAGQKSHTIWDRCILTARRGQRSTKYRMCDLQDECQCLGADFRTIAFIPFRAHGIIDSAMHHRLRLRCLHAQQRKQCLSPPFPLREWTEASAKHAWRIRENR